MNLDELFEKMESKARTAVPPADAPDCRVLLDVQGEDPRRWLVSCQNGAVAVSVYAGGETDASIILGADTLIGVATRALSPAMAFFTGRLKIKGNKSLLKQLSLIWPD
ncbi:MAG: SCP2 sterol-binding domain-containing protein [Deltaproteobacteria bacterium]|jgi:putative sterol carrier protein|nr:SCP2 sterol-binding domain-containing protein [Deltaproteobacteria bacterium]